MQEPLSPFHLAIAVSDLKLCTSFYQQVLGCELGRCAETWQDLNFFGHQLVLHEAKNHNKIEANPVDGHSVPIPHFGVVLTMPEWQNLKKQLLKAEIQFEIKPHIRFQGQVGEQATMFFYDPSGNALEFKAFADRDSQLFRAD